MTSLTIEDLKAQKRWVLWRLEPRPGETKLTKTPYQSNGVKASSTDPSTWVTYAEALEHAHKFSGVGCVTGEVDGIHCVAWTLTTAAMHRRANSHRSRVT